MVVELMKNNQSAQCTLKLVSNHPSPELIILTVDVFSRWICFLNILVIGLFFTQCGAHGDILIHSNRKIRYSCQQCYMSRVIKSSSFHIFSCDFGTLLLNKMWYKYIFPRKQLLNLLYAHAIVFMVMTSTCYHNKFEKKQTVYILTLQLRYFFSLVKYFGPLQEFRKCAGT